MPWLLVLHIVALVCWCGSLLYLPALIAVTARNEALSPAARTTEDRASMTRMVFTTIMTPAALVAIASGTAVFLVNHIVAGWLIAKLSLVAGLVFCHVINGWLILYIEQGPRKHETLLCAGLGIVSAAFMAGILWLVLAKPF